MPFSTAPSTPPSTASRTCPASPRRSWPRRGAAAGGYRGPAHFPRPRHTVQPPGRRRRWHRQRPAPPASSSGSIRASKSSICGATSPRACEKLAAPVAGCHRPRPRRPGPAGLHLCQRRRRVRRRLLSRRPARYPARHRPGSHRRRNPAPGCLHVRHSRRHRSRANPHSASAPSGNCSASSRAIAAFPVAARAVLDGSGNLQADAIVFRDGEASPPARAHAAGPATDPEAVARRLFDQLSSHSS